MTVDILLPVLAEWTDEKLREKKQQLPQMRSMILCGRGFTDEGMRLLDECSNLRELHLIETSITDTGLRHLANLHSLRWLKIDGAAVTDDGLRDLFTLNRLEGLQLVKTEIGDDGLRTLLSCPSLSYLEASSPHIGDRGMSAISQIPSLEVLRISAPMISDSSFLHLSLARSLASLTFDLPLVSQSAVSELRRRMPGCLFFEFNTYRPEDKVIFLIRHFIEEGHTFDEYKRALFTADELLSLNPFHPATHGARAMINYRIGDLDQFRQDLSNARDNASLYGEFDLLKLASDCLSQTNASNIRRAVEETQAERFVAQKLLSSSLQSPLRKEPVTALIQRLRTAAAPAPAGSAIITPDQVRVDVTLQWLKELKKTNDVPWQW